VKHDVVKHDVVKQDVVTATTMKLEREGCRVQRERARRGGKEWASAHD
jgi:hypothetical protein